VIGPAIDRLDAAGARYRKPIGILMIGWFAVSCAQYAGFLTLPNFNPFGELAMLVLSAIANALWWGMLAPRLEMHRARRRVSETTNG